MTVQAIYKNGVFLPTEPVDLPDNSRVELESRLLPDEEEDRAAQKRIYELLGKSLPSGESDVAERHNEHQP